VYFENHFIKFTHALDNNLQNMYYDCDNSDDYNNVSRRIKRMRETSINYKYSTVFIVQKTGLRS